MVRFVMRRNEESRMMEAVPDVRGDKAGRAFSLSAEEGDGTDQTVTDGLVAAQTLFVNDILSSVVRKGIVAQPKEDESEITVSFPQDLDLEGVESPPGVDSLDALTMRPAPSSIRLWIEAHKLSMLHGHLPPSVVTL